MKWGAREDLVFVGYSTESKAYRLWHRDTTQIEHYDVHFIEDLRFLTRVRKRGFIFSVCKSYINEANKESNADDQAQEKDKHTLNNDIDYQIITEEERLIGENNDAQKELSQDKEDAQSSSINLRKGSGRSKIIQTRQHGRPKKEY